MAKILEFRPPAPKPLTEAERRQELLTPKQAVDAIVTGMLQVVIPMWVEKDWSFMQLEVMAYELRIAMSRNVPETIHRYQVDTIIEELTPVWIELAKEGSHLF